MSEPGTAAERLVGDLKAAWEVARSIEPARGQVSQEQVTRVRAALEKIEMARATLDAHEDADALKASFATVYARSAVVAIAAGSESNAARWLANAEALSKDDEQLAELRAARKTHERYRALVHGRNLIANRRESEARKEWSALAKEQVKGVEPDAITKAAIAELKAPRPLQPHDKMPTLLRYNGIGAGFYGRRDRWPDGSYATTHCFSVLWVPLFPFSAWRVRDAARGYTIMAKEQLSGFARAMRLVIPLLIVAGIAGSAINGHLNDPHRLARLRFDDALAAAKTAQTSDREAALRQLDGELEHDGYMVDQDRAELAGAQVVRLATISITRPFTADKLDQAARLARRYHALPDPARHGVAQAAMLATLDGWTKDLGDQLDTADARLALLGYAAEIAPAERKRDLAEQMTTTRIAIAAAKQADWPLDALAILVQEPNDLAIQQADKIVARLVDSPSLLLDAGADFDAWKAATKSTELRDQASAARDLATAARDEVDAEGVTSKQLAQMAAKWPWDQRVALQLARNDAAAGKLDAAAARLVKLGTPGLTIREVRFTLAQIRTAQGKLEEADAILTQLLDARLAKFVAASAAYRDAIQALQDRLKTMMQTGTIPLELQHQLEAASASEDRQRELVHAWVQDQMAHDAPSTAAREKYLALSDIVPVSLAAGSVKLRRAQALSGAARSAMLEDAEKVFLAIRTEAEDRPEFQLGLGEIYARLGKTKESDAAFETVLALKDPKLSLNVAAVYRQIGSIERAKQIAKDVLAQGDGELKDGAALMLGIMSDGDDDEAERWYKLADAKNPAVKIALLDLEGKRLLRQNKPAECAAKFEAVAKANLANAGDQRTTGDNNAAVAHEHRYECNGDPQALRDAEAALENAYRSQPDDPIVAGNLAAVLDYNGRLRVLGKRVDVRALRLDGSEVVTVINKLLDSPERDAVLAELAADPGVRRGDELLAQYEVLAPNSPTPYAQRFDRLVARRDVDGAAALLERARHAKALDTSEGVAQRDKVRSGDADARYLDQAESERARLAQALPTLDPRSRAVALYLSARSEGMIGLFKGDAAAIAHARASAVKAMQLWPMLDTSPTIINILLDQAGVETDAKAWLDLRRGRSGGAALAKLTADGSPLAAKIRAAKPWAEIAAYAQADHTRPDVDALRLARLLGDPAVEARAKAVLDDRLEHLRLELGLVLLPGDESTKDDLATLDKR